MTGDEGQFPSARLREEVQVWGFSGQPGQVKIIWAPPTDQTYLQGCSDEMIYLSFFWVLAWVSMPEHVVAIGQRGFPEALVAHPLGVLSCQPML